MDVVGLVGMAIIGTILAVLLGQYKPEYRMLVSLITGTVMLFFIVEGAVPLFSQLETLLDGSNMPKEYLSILLKCLGICFLTQLASDTCRDAGETAIASKVEIGGKVMVLLLSLPLFTQILSVAGTLFTL